jgi:hypothetical protein
VKNSLFDSIQNLRKVINEDGDMLPTEEVEVKPEITDEMVEELFNAIPDSAGLDKEQFKQGLQVELEHYDTANKEMTTIANIVVDHLKEIPTYYTYLSEMEAKAAEDAKASETPAEETPAEEAPVVTEEPVEGTTEGKIPAKPSEYSEKDIKTLMEDTIKYVPKGEYQTADAQGVLTGNTTILDVAIEGELIKEENGKKLIKLVKKSVDEPDIFILVDVPLESKAKEVKTDKTDKVENIK